MIHTLDGRLREEALHFGLMFTCPDCAHFDPDADGCSLGYPSEPHKQSILNARDQIAFCKYFELW